MKSKGELIISGVLEKHKINYVYEYPLLIKETKVNDTEKYRIWYPDFWLPELSIIIEFWGRLGDPVYRRGKDAKLRAYKKLNIDVISVNPDTLKKDYEAYILLKIKEIVKNRLDSVNFIKF